MNALGLGLVGWLLLLTACSNSPVIPVEQTKSLGEYQSRFLRQKEFLRESIALDAAREALHAAILQNPLVDGIAVREDLIFSEWNFHLDCPECSVQADDWTVGMVSEGGEKLNGISFSIGFDPKTKRVIRGGSADQVHFDFSFRHDSDGLKLVFIGAGTDHFTLTY